MSEMFGAHLRFIRKSHTDYTQTDVARMLYMDRSTYSNYEIGKSEPSIGTLKKLCGIFRVDAATLLNYEENEYIV